MTRRRPTPTEQRMWARVARTVKPLEGKAPPELPETAPQEPTRDTSGEPASLPPNPLRATGRPAATFPARSPAPAHRGSERRIRRGQVDLAARFDLHGHTQASAERALKAFLASQQQQGARCVLVITGKGRDGESVLRRNFLHWLDSGQARRLVSGWSQAHARHGGHGAFYLFLRRAER